jgi:hypothetical protein
LISWRTLARSIDWLASTEDQSGREHGWTRREDGPDVVARSPAGRIVAASTADAALDWLGAWREAMKESDEHRGE